MCSPGFLSSSWHITSRGMFAGSCIGVVALVCALEFLRRLGREYDRYLVFRGARSPMGLGKAIATASEDEEQRSHHGPDKITAHTAETSSSSSRGNRSQISGTQQGASFRPTVLNQIVRSAIHMLQFAVAYFIMLLAMYYNGFIIICIFIGAFVGSFIFGWDLAPKQEPSGCCG